MYKRQECVLLIGWFSENFGDQSGVFACENLDWSPKFSLNDKTLTGPIGQDAPDGVDPFKPLMKQA